MALKGEVVYKGITVADAHCVVIRANHDNNYNHDIDGVLVKSMSAYYQVKFYKDAATYAADHNNCFDQKEFNFTPSVGNGVNLNIVKQAYVNMKTIAAYDDFTDV